MVFHIATSFHNARLTLAIIQAHIFSVKREGVDSYYSDRKYNPKHGLHSSSYRYMMVVV